MTNRLTSVGFSRYMICPVPATTTRRAFGIPASIAPACAWTSAISASPVRITVGTRISCSLGGDDLFRSRYSGCRMSCGFAESKSKSRFLAASFLWCDQVFIFRPFRDCPIQIAFIQEFECVFAAIEKMLRVRLPPKPGPTSTSC